MSDYKCPNCESENIQKFSIAHDTLGERDKYYTDNNGKLHVLTEYSRPDLAAPKPPEHDGTGCIVSLTVYFVASFFAFWGYALGFKNIGNVSLAVIVGAFLYPFVLSKVHKKKHEEALAKYHAEKDTYDRSYICLRCGEKFIL